MKGQGQLHVPQSVSSNLGSRKSILNCIKSASAHRGSGGPVRSAMESSIAGDRMDIVLEDEDVTRVVLVSVVGAYRQLRIF